MSAETLTAAIAALAAILALIVVLRQGAANARQMEHLRLLAEQNLAGARAEAEAVRAEVRAAGTNSLERLTILGGAFATGIEQVRTTLSREQGELRLALADGEQKTATAIGAQFETTRTLLETDRKSVV